MEKEYAVLWEDNITIDSDSELIDEQKFVGKRKAEIFRSINLSNKSLLCK